MATDFINRFREDVALMKQAGLTHYRTSINWSRFLTDYENATVDEEYAAYYDALFDEMHRQGIEPMICLGTLRIAGRAAGNLRRLGVEARRRAVRSLCGKSV